MTCGIGNYSLEKSRDGVIQHPEPEDTTFHPLIDGWTGERYTAFPERDLRGFKAEGPPMHLKYIEINVINPLGKAKHPPKGKRKKPPERISRRLSGTLKHSPRSSGLHRFCRWTEPVARVGEPNDRSAFEVARVDREPDVNRSGEGG